MLAGVISQSAVAVDPITMRARLLSGGIVSLRSIEGNFGFEHHRRA
jgi:hypothetical protein